MCNMNPVVSASLNKAGVRNGFDSTDLQIPQIFLLFQTPFSICHIITQYIQTEALKYLFKNLINCFHNQFAVLQTDFTYPITHTCQILSRFSPGTESSRTDTVFTAFYSVCEVPVGGSRHLCLCVSKSTPLLLKYLYGFEGVFAD